MKICENCFKEYDGIYNKSGRFCSYYCSKSYGFKIINKTKVYCNICNKYISKPSYSKHIKIHEKENNFKYIIFKCENCGIEFKGEYRKSNRFCSKNCTKSFSTKNKRKEINEKVSIKLTGINRGGKKIIHSCLYCKKEFITNSNISIYCSKSCQNKYQFLNKPKSDITKLNMKNSALLSYKNGKNVSGGRTKWYQYKDIKVQGTFELRTCFILDKWKEQNIIKDWEYTKDTIQYIGLDNKKHSYLLDFKVFKNDDTFYYLEIKGYIHENDKLKWDAAKKQGFTLDIWFEKHIKEKEYGYSH